MKADVGRSDADKAKEAGLNASKEALENLENEPDITFVFSSVKYNQEEMLDAVSEEMGDSEIIGCSTGGEITSEGESTETVAVMAMEDDEAEISIGVGRDIGADEREAGRQAAKNALEGLEGEEFSVRSLESDGEDWVNNAEVDFTVFSTTLTGNGSEVMRGIQEIVGEGFQIAGGLAGDDWELDSTYVYQDGDVLSDSVVVAAMKSSKKRAVGIKHGLVPTEHDFEVTDVDGNVVKELDGQPPAEVYKDIFGKKGGNAQFLMTKPLGVEAGEEELRLRDPLIVNDDGSIVFAAEIKEGSRVTIMESPQDEVIDGAKQAAQQAYEKAGEPDEIGAVLLHDCVCRWHCLKNSETRNEEIESVKEVVGEDTPVLGWYTYGEIAMPRTLAGVHNQTLIVQLFADE